MRRLYSFWMLFALASGFFASAQTTPFKKAAQMKTQKVYWINDGESSQVNDQYMNYYFYDKNGNMLSDAKHSLPSGNLYDKHTYTYNEDGKMLVDTWSYSSGPRTIIENEYNEKGLLVKTNTYSMFSGKKLSGYDEFTYDDNDLLEEKTQYNADGSVFMRTVYSYNNGKLSETNSYKANDSGNLDLIERMNYSYDNLGQLEKDSTTEFYLDGAGVQMHNPKGWNIYGYENGRLVEDSTYAKDFLSGKVEPNMRHFYQYDADGNLIKTTEVGYNSDKKGFVNDYQYFTYTLGTYSAARMATKVGVTASDKLATVNITFQAPTDKAGLEGYKVIVDGAVSDKLFPADQTTIELGGQQNGAHSYGVVGIYDGIPSTVSDMATFEVKVNLPAPTGLTAPTYRYDSTWRRWYIQMKWDAVDPGELTLKNYKILMNGQNGGSYPTNSAEVNFEGLAVVTFQLFAVYAEGESDPVEITLDLSDPKNEITENWQNASKVVMDLATFSNVVTRYIYNNNGSKERLAAEVEYDAEGVAVGKTELVYDYGQVIERIHYSFNKDTWTWTKDRSTTYNENEDVSNIGTIETETLGNDGKFIVSEKDEYIYNGTTYALDKIEHSELVDGKLAVTSVIKLSTEGENGEIQVRTFYSPDETSITGKEESVYDGKNITKKTVYTYNGKDYAVESTVVYGYDTNSGLLAMEDYSEMKDGKLTAVTSAFYSSSSAYAPTHMATDLVARVNGANVNLGWKAPARTEDLSGYMVLVNDVKYGKQLDGHEHGEVVDKNGTSIVITGIPNPADCEYKVIPVYSTGEATCSAAAEIREGAKYANLKELMDEAPEGDVVVTGEVLVTGKMGMTYFIEDASAAVQLTPADELSDFPYQVGDKIKNLAGVMDMGAMYPTFLFDAAEKVSSDNKVEPEVKTMAEVIANPEAYSARFVKFEKIKFEGVSMKDEVLPYMSQMKQDDAKMTLMVGQLQIPVPNRPVNVSGFVVGSGESLMMIFTDEKDMELYTVKYADIKSMREATKFADLFELTGEAVVTGVISSGANPVCYVEDGTGALSFELDEMSDVSFKKGDKITKLVGYMSEYDGIHTFSFYSAEKVSEGNPVYPKVVTFDELLNNGGNYESQFIKLEKVTLEENEAGYYCNVKQDGKEMKMFKGYMQVDFPDYLVNVSGFVDYMDEEWMLFLPGVEYIEEAPVSYATLREMLDAGVSADHKAYEVNGEVLVTGIVPGMVQTFYFVEDATAAVQVSVGEMGTFPYQVGDKIKNMKGYLDEWQGAHMFEIESAEKVSEKNAVVPTVMTVAAVKENVAANESKFVKFENVTINAVTDGEYPFEIVQGDAKISMMVGMTEIETMPEGPVNVAGFVSVNGDNATLMLAGDSYIEETTRTFATLKEMIDAGMDEGKTDIITGEVLVTGVVSLGAEYGSAYFVEDATAAIRCSLDEGVNNFPFQKGDKIQNLTGALDEYEGAHSFWFRSAEKVSSGNTVSPIQTTIADLNANLEANESRFVELTDVSFDTTEPILPYLVKMQQGNASMNLMIAGEEITTPKDAADVTLTGFLSLEGDPYIIMTSFVDGISVMEVSGMYYENGKVIANGASLMEVYDVAGRRLAHTTNGEVAVNGISGTIMVKAIYSNGEVKVMKLAIK